MELNFINELCQDTLLSHMVLHGLSLNEILLNKCSGKSEKLDIKLLVNNEEIDIIDFINHWESQVDRLIKEQAQEIIKTKMNDIEDLYYQLNEKIQNEVNKRLEDWER
jgi:hypothetical protein